MSAIELTKEEKFKVQELRQRVNHIYSKPDEILITWLRARDLDVDRAEQMLRRHLIWRKHNEIDTLMDWKSPKCFFPILHMGYDIEGCPVFLLPIGKWELRGVIENGDIIPGLRFIYQYLERVVSTCHAAKVYQGITIFDFDGFGYRQIAHRTVIQGILEVLRVFEANFPETLKYAFVINAPKIFNVLFQLVKPLLHSRTLSKVRIYNSDKRKWQEHLLELITKDQIPPYWGGTREGKDEYCSESWMDEPLPKYFMRKISSTSDEYGDEWFQIKVSAGETITLDYEVVEDGKDNSLQWNFTTEGYDIGFGITYTSEEGNSSFPLVPLERVDSHMAKQTGKLKLTKPGKYTISFDNSFSRSRSKTLNYSVVLTQVDPLNLVKGMNNFNIINNNRILQETN